MSERILYLPSTPFNLVVALLDYLERKPEKAGLVLIDQRQTLPYLHLLQNTPDFSFEYVASFPAAQGWLKPWVRHRQFHELEGLAKQIKPTAVAVGSDRRVEFQYLMHVLRAQGEPVRGIYLDDGLYSYLEWPMRPLSRWFDTFAKKMAYGRWWQAPPQVGDGKWIDEAVLFAPKMARSTFQDKVLHAVPVHRIMEPAFERLASRIARSFSVDVDNLRQAKHVVLVPHPHNLEKYPALERTLRSLVNRLSEENVWIKYHPRHEQDDALNLSRHGVQFLPKSAALEFFVPLFPKNITLHGDLTTALLSSIWLRPDIKSEVIPGAESELSPNVIALYKAFGVKVSPDEK